jgi:3-methyladenine DNA glycosylase AlkD
MAQPLVRDVRRALRDAANPAKAPQMQAYMKSVMPYRGVSAPEQRRLWRALFAAYPLATASAWRATVLELWRGATYREERYAAIALIGRPEYARYRTFAAMPMLEEMVVTGAWWDYVDAIATHHIGDVLRVDPRRMKPLMRRWARVRSSSGGDAGMWKRRAAILCQIRFKTDTDLDLLYACIEPNLDDREFFIRKAIGWALRQYAWTDAREVKRFVAANRRRLSALSIREALKNI